MPHHALAEWTSVEPLLFRPDDLIDKPPVADAADDCLNTLASDVGTQLGADTVVFAWHETGQEPTVVVASGRAEPRPAVERDRIRAFRRSGLTSVTWVDGDGGAATLTGRIGIDAGQIEVTATFSGPGDRRGSADQALMHLLPVIGTVFRLWLSRARVLAANQGLKAALNGNDMPTLLVDADGLPVFVNDAAERLIAAGNGLYRKGRQLTGRRVADTIRLQSAIEHVVHSFDTAEDLTPVVPLSRESGRSLLAAVVAADRHTTSDRATAAIIYIVDPDGGMESLLAPVCRLYGLTMVEGRLAALLAQGEPFCEAAKHMRVQEQTARSYLKQIFVKTDTNRQSELVGLMLRSAVHTAPDLKLSFI